MRSSAGAAGEGVRSTTYDSRIALIPALSRKRGAREQAQAHPLLTSPASASLASSVAGSR